MRLRLIPPACGLLLLSLGIPAYGVNCYQIWDARDNLLYQSHRPPFDLSKPAFDRSMANLRAQRQTLIFFDTPDCAIIGSTLTGPQSRASLDPASLLDIRSSDPGYARGSGGGMLSPTPASIGNAAPVSVPPQAGTNTRPSTGTNTGTSGRY